MKIRWSPITGISMYWNMRVAIIPTLSSMMAAQVVITTTCVATIDDKVGIMITPFSVYQERRSLLKQGSGPVQPYLDLDTLKQKGHQDDCPAHHWRRWRQASTSPVMTRAVTLTTFPFPCMICQGLFMLLHVSPILLHSPVSIRGWGFSACKCIDKSHVFCVHCDRLGRKLSTTLIISPQKTAAYYLDGLLSASAMGIPYLCAKP